MAHTAPASPADTEGMRLPWHARPADRVLQELGVDPTLGLSSAEAQRRAERYGPNRLAEPPRERRIRAFLRQFQDLMIVVLLVAAAASLLVGRTWETTAAIGVVILLNASIGFIQESRAEASLASLRRLTVTTASVRRDGQTERLAAVELVPGDIVSFEAGDVVPADGRLVVAAALEVQEAALTGESQPVAKDVDAEVSDEAPVADRLTAVFLGSAVTRGRGEMVVTATGMATETGRIAGLLTSVSVPFTPLQQQISGLGRTLAAITGGVVVVVLALGLVRGADFDEVFVTAVALAVAAIPEGLPAVVAFTLAAGTARLAKRGAIVKRLASVETLGSTSQICTDKTGTLTLNQMTVREVLLPDHELRVTGEGYRIEGRIESVDGSPAPAHLDQALLAAALCNDAVVGADAVTEDPAEDAIIGDPTEAALVVLAEKNGIDVVALRRQHPRLREVPFDSDHKFMATFHRWAANGAPADVRGFVKGAPDVLIGLGDRCLTDAGVRPLDDAERRRYAEASAGLARRGMRVLALGYQDVPVSELDAADDITALVGPVVLTALVGIVDPPRAEAKEATAQCQTAGIRVRMVTGDHPLTAQAVAAEVGIPGRTVTGADLDAIAEDRDLADLLDEVGVVARVAPSHKLRIVQALQARGDVVAMTGDGVNDAPALRRADIGVAMGITGTEVTKDAATAVLTDDNFATVVTAVREGRGIYDNIVKFTQFQVSTALAFVMTFLVASLTGLAGGAPFSAVQILFVNLVMDGPPAVSLGVAAPAPDVMTRPPRGRRERILSGPRLRRILLASAVMSAGTLAVLLWAPGEEPGIGLATVAGTMAFTTFVIFQIFNLINLRNGTRSVLSRETPRNRAGLIAVISVVALLLIVVQLDLAHEIFATTDLTPAQWLTCLGVGSSVLWLGELLKLQDRRRRLRGGHLARR